MHIQWCNVCLIAMLRRCGGVGVGVDKFIDITIIDAGMWIQVNVQSQ